MKFTLTIESDNAAMVDAPHEETIAILRHVIRDLECRISSAPVRDSNGNHVGQWSMALDEED